MELPPESKARTSDLEKLFEKVYFFELDRKDKVNARVNFVVANVLMIVGWTSAYIKNVPKFSDIGNLILFYVPIVIVALILVRLLQLIYHFLFRFDYKYTSNVGEVDSYLKSLEAFNKNSENKVNIGEKLSEMLICRYQEAATKNYENNHQKQKLIVTMQKLLFAAIVSLSLSGIPFLIYFR